MKHLSPYSSTPEEYVFARIEIDVITGCWNWQLALDSNGYGPVKYRNGLTPELKVSRAHQLTYLLWKGDIPEDMVVCHKCDNPQCCNPDHLFLGTQDDNMKDCVFKKRTNIKYDKEYIRSLRGKPIKQILLEANISKTHLYRIWNNKV